MKRSIFAFMLLIALFTFAVFSAGGCGSSSSSNFADNSGDEPVENVDNAAKPETVLSLNAGLDSDGDGVPDIVDFRGIPMYDLDSYYAQTDGVNDTFASAAVFAAAALNVTVPARLALSELRAQEEPNIFSVRLQAGKEYTIMFSKNLAEALEAVMPRIKVYKPAVSEELEELEDIEVSAYPPEHPSIICYTFTPETTGDYSVQVADLEPSTVRIEDEEEAAETDTYEFDTSCMLFVFEERHDAEGNNGHHTQYKFADVNGAKTEAMDIEDVIQLRKEIMNISPDLYDGYLGRQTVNGANKGDRDKVYASALEVYSALSPNDVKSYNSYLNIAQDHLGLVAVDNEEVTYGDSDTDDGIAFYGGTEDNNNSNKVLATSSTGDLSNYSQIPATITGVPYDDTYGLGAGFCAITNQSPVGGMQMRGFDTALAPATGKKAPPVETNYYATFVSTRTEAEAMSNTNGRLGMSKNSMGASVSAESTANLKYGLTTTNLRIHYEEMETAYRAYTTTKYESLLYRPLSERRSRVPANKDISYDDDVVFDSSAGGEVKAAADETLIIDWIERLPADMFRENFGDYFVAGYKYGACFDAYIAITTQTTEQLQKTKLSIQAAMQGKDLTASGDLSHEVSDALKEGKADVNIRIVTVGMGKEPVEINISHDTSASNDMKITSGINTVFSELMNFRSKLAGQVNPEQYAPVKVKLIRWRSLMDIGIAHTSQIGKGITDNRVAEGYVPVPSSKAVKIGQFNSALANTRGYRNTVMSIPTTNAKLTKALSDFEGVLLNVTTKGNEFYTSGDQISPAMVELERINDIFNAYADRYAFYNKLVNAQNSEKETYERLRTQYNQKTKDSEKQAIMHTMPYGAATGGSSGFDAFDVSPYVTEDIKAGKKVSKNYARSAGVGWWRWHSSHATDDDDYLESAGDAKIFAATNNASDRARFCKIWVRSTAASDQRDNEREVVNVPAVGKQRAEFEFEGGYDRDVNWTIEGQSIRMNGEDYPFEGMQE